mmetsp:Transcript_37762/g.93858  ORF Transcript_37762/g.93858 Transcript_37762/m.93858 type:complete len:135 (-) Transcript_37762:373-777(-)
MSWRLLLAWGLVAALAQADADADADALDQSDQTGTAWQGFAWRHRIKHGDGFEHEGGEERKWYEPAYAEYRMAPNTLAQYVVTWLVFALPAIALYVCARRAPPHSVLAKVFMMNVDESTGRESFVEPRTSRGMV